MLHTAEGVVWVFRNTATSTTALSDTWLRFFGERGKHSTKTMIWNGYGQDGRAGIFCHNVTRKQKSIRQFVNSYFSHWPTGALDMGSAVAQMTRVNNEYWPVGAWRPWPVQWWPAQSTSGSRGQSGSGPATSCGARQLIRCKDNEITTHHKLAAARWLRNLASFQHVLGYSRRDLRARETGSDIKQ